MSKKIFSCVVVFTVFGVYSHGALAGKTNPKAFCDVTVYGESFKDCKGKINSISDGAFYRVKSVSDMPVREVSRPMTGFLATMSDEGKKLALAYDGDDTVGDLKREVSEADVDAAVKEIFG